MTRLPLVAKRAEELLGSAVVATAPVAGGDINTATRMRLSDGTTALMKTNHHAPEGFFEAEERGLRWLAEAGGVAVPEVLPSDQECLILRWVEPGKTTVDAAVSFGQALATTHAAGAPAYGLEHDGFIGRLPMPNKTAPTWAEFYATRRVLPYLKLARDRGMATEEDATPIEAVIGKFPELLPEEPPSRLHGDLWNGNVIWSLDGIARSSTRRRTAATVRSTWRCCPSSGCHTCPGSSTRTPRCRRSRTAGRTASRCTSCSRCWCTPACSAAGTPPARPGSRPASCDGRDPVRAAISQGWLRLGWHSRHVTAPAVPKPRVLVVDDDKAVRESLRRSLEFNGYDVSMATDGAEALAGIAVAAPDIVVMDVMMPRLDGIEATKALRKAGNDVPIIVLTARDAVGDRVEGLDAGADDYLTKPFALQELLARLRALLRRVVPPEDAPDETLTFADLSMDIATREVRRGDRLVELTRTEFTLLEMFLRRPRRVLERSFILEEVWGYDFPTTANSLEVYVGYVRRKLEAEGESRLIHTVRGVGYVLKES